ncbi:MAG: NAD-dependent epimerase/dehydratase family protein [Rubrobacteraceae bacterium]
MLLLSQALSGRPLTVYGDGSHTRSIQYVDDLIEGAWRLMRSSEARPVNLAPSSTRWERSPSW